MIQQNRNIMTLRNVLAHANSLGRKRRGIYPQMTEKLLNHRPRKCLNDRTPNEVFHEPRGALAI